MGCGVVVVMIVVPARAAFVMVALDFACSVQIYKRPTRPPRFFWRSLFLPEVQLQPGRS